MPPNAASLVNFNCWVWQEVNICSLMSESSISCYTQRFLYGLDKGELHYFWLNFLQTWTLDSGIFFFWKFKTCLWMLRIVMILFLKALSQLLKCKIWCLILQISKSIVGLISMLYLHFFAKKLYFVNLYKWYYMYKWDSEIVITGCST